MNDPNSNSLQKRLAELQPLDISENLRQSIEFRLQRPAAVQPSQRVRWRALTISGCIAAGLLILSIPLMVLWPANPQGAGVADRGGQRHVAGDAPEIQLPNRYLQNVGAGFFVKDESYSAFDRNQFELYK